MLSGLLLFFLPLATMAAGWEGNIVAETEVDGRRFVKEACVKSIVSWARCYFPDEADTVVIAGMGGDNIVDILSAAPWTREGTLLLLQPMSRPETLRRWLPENGYAVTAEELVLDKGTIYPILSVRGGHMPPATDGEVYGGFLLGEDPLWGPYLEDRILRLRKAAAGLARARDEGLAQRREMFLAAAAALSEKKGEWERAHRT